MEEFVFEKKFKERFKIMILFFFCLFLSAVDWMYFVPQLDRFVQIFDSESLENNSDNFLLNYIILAVYPVAQFPIQYLTETNIKMALVTSQLFQIAGYAIRIVMINLKNSKIAVQIFVFSQILNTIGVVIILSSISKLVTVWFPISERIWALMACMAIFLLGSVSIFLLNLLFQEPILVPGKKT